MTALFCLLTLLASTTTTAWVSSGPKSVVTTTITTSSSGSRRRLCALSAAISRDVKFALWQEQQRALASKAKLENEWMGELRDLESYTQLPMPDSKVEADLKKRIKKRTKKSGGGGKAKGFGGGGAKAARAPLKSVSPEAITVGLAQVM